MINQSRTQEKLEGNGITINEAIEVLEYLQRTLPMPTPEERPKAIALGKEALKRIQSDRALYSFRQPQLLPGEAEE